MIKELVCIVSGRVHGVLYRDFTCRTARKLDLSGTVRNLDDGTVEVVAQGEEAKLNEFLLHIRKGPPLARVDAVATSWQAPSHPFSNFKIVYKNFLDRF